MKKVTERLLSLPHETLLVYNHLQPLYFYLQRVITALLKTSAFVVTKGEVFWLY